MFQLFKTLFSRKTTNFTKFAALEPKFTQHFHAFTSLKFGQNSVLYTLISELKMTLYKRESFGFLLVLIEMRHYFLKTN